MLLSLSLTTGIAHQQTRQIPRHLADVKIRPGEPQSFAYAVGELSRATVIASHSACADTSLARVPTPY